MRLHAAVRADTLTAETLNEAMRTRADGLLAYTDEGLASSDIAGTEHASIFDATQTKVARASEGRYLVEAAAWFDNETSYMARFVELAAYLGTLYHLADLG